MRRIRSAVMEGRSASIRGADRLLCFLMLFVFLLASPAWAAPIEDIPPTPHFAPEGTSSAEMIAAIRNAGEDFGWRTLVEDPGEVLATIFVRNRHRATVLIRFDESNYSIEYISSEGLDYRDRARNKATLNRNPTSESELKERRIHRNYNRWVKNLSDRVALYLKNPPKQGAPRLDGEAEGARKSESSRSHESSMGGQDG